LTAGLSTDEPTVKIAAAIGIAASASVATAAIGTRAQRLTA
jgi:hypothetical protein